MYSANSGEGMNVVVESRHDIQFCGKMHHLTATCSVIDRQRSLTVELTVKRHLNVPKIKHKSHLDV